MKVKTWLMIQTVLLGVIAWGIAAPVALRVVPVVFNGVSKWIEAQQKRADEHREWGAANASRQQKINAFWDQIPGCSSTELAAIKDFSDEYYECMRKAESLRSSGFR